MKLKACPFCGGDAAVCDIKEPSANGWVGCQRCRCFMDFIKNGKPLAIAAWNRRAQPENEPLTCEGCTYFEDDYEFDPCRGCKRLVRANDYYRRKPERSEG